MAHVDGRLVQFFGCVFLIGIIRFIVLNIGRHNPGYPIVSLYAYVNTNRHRSLFCHQRQGKEYAVHVFWPDSKCLGDVEEGWDVVEAMDSCIMTYCEPRLAYNFRCGARNRD